MFLVYSTWVMFSNPRKTLLKTVVSIHLVTKWASEMYLTAFCRFFDSRHRKLPYTVLLVFAKIIRPLHSKNPKICIFSLIFVRINGCVTLNNLIFAYVFKYLIVSSGNFPLLCYFFLTVQCNTIRMMTTTGENTLQL